MREEIRADDGSDGSDRLADLLAADRAREFDLVTAPLLRLVVIRRPGIADILLITFHHAILDGRALQLLLTEVFTEYDALRTGAGWVAPVRRPYPDFTRWYAAHDAEPGRRFWGDLLRRHPDAGDLPLSPATQLPARRPDTVRETGRRLDTRTTAALRTAAAEAGVPLSTLVTAAWGLVLQRYSGRDDVCFGTVRSCRRGSVDGAENSIGLLINTVPQPVTVHPGHTLRDWLPLVRRQVTALRAYQATPLSEITTAAGRPATSRLFETVLMYDHRELRTVLAETVPGWGERPVTVHRHPSSAVTLCVFGDNRLRVQLYHDRRRLGDPAADHLLRQFTTLLAAMATGLDTPVADLPLADAAAAAQLAGWSVRRRRPALAATLDAAFAAQVRSRPGRLAVTGADGALTYAALDDHATRLAQLLIRRGVGPDTPVAVALPRSVRLVVVLLAIVKAGGAYLALDPAAPPQRNRELLARSGALLTVVGGEPVELPAGHPVLRLDEVAAETTTAGPLAARARPESLAYLSFTSGSTGVPKAVAVPHRAVLRLVDRPGYLRLGPRQRILQLAPASFDAATLEIWGALLTGARLVVAPAGPLGPAEIARLLRDERITVGWLTAGLFHQLVEHDAGALAGVRQLLAGGDVLDPAAVRAALHARPRLPLINGYGPTENTTFTTCHRMTRPGEVAVPVPIGRPVRGSTVHVLDARLRPVPVGVPGELYTGGEGVARGYHGSPAATAERFLPDPFAGRPGARMYRTGDRVRWRPDGTLEFLGRTDRQVKIRGFRVEPAEVEAVLQGCPQVGSAAVTVEGAGERRRLVAYLAPPAGGPDAPALEASAVRAYAQERLPLHLRPADYHVLARLPLNPNGKIDRAALAAAVPATEPAASDVPPPAPGDAATVARLAGVWSELLDRPVSAGDFFALGGNSLLATRLTFLIADRFGVRVPLRALYDHSELHALATEIDRLAGTAAPGPGRDRGAGPVGVPAGGPGHLVRPAPGPWAIWRWVGLRAAGFAIEPLTRLGDPELLAATDVLLAAEDRLTAARRELLDRLHTARLAGDPGDRSTWNRAERRVRQGQVPQRLPGGPGQEELAAALAAFARAQDAHDTAAGHFAAAHRSASAGRPGAAPARRRSATAGGGHLAEPARPADRSRPAGGRPGTDHAAPSNASTRRWSPPTCSATAPRTTPSASSAR